MDLFSRSSQTFSCSGQWFRWHSREQYLAQRHLPHERQWPQSTLTPQEWQQFLEIGSLTICGGRDCIVTMPGSLPICCQTPPDSALPDSTQSLDSTNTRPALLGCSTFSSCATWSLVMTALLWAKNAAFRIPFVLFNAFNLVFSRCKSGLLPPACDVTSEMIRRIWCKNHSKIYHFRVVNKEKNE